MEVDSGKRVVVGGWWFVQTLRDNNLSSFISDP